MDDPFKPLTHTFVRRPPQDKLLRCQTDDEYRRVWDRYNPGLAGLRYPETARARTDDPANDDVSEGARDARELTDNMCVFLEWLASEKLDNSPPAVATLEYMIEWEQANPGDYVRTAHEWAAERDRADGGEGE